VRRDPVSEQIVSGTRVPALLVSSPCSPVLPTPVLPIRRCLPSGRGPRVQRGASRLRLTPGERGQCARPRRLRPAVPFRHRQSPHRGGPLLAPCRPGYVFANAEKLKPKDQDPHPPIRDFVGSRAEPESECQNLQRFCYAKRRPQQTMPADVFRLESVVGAIGIRLTPI